MCNSKHFQSVALQRLLSTPPHSPQRPIQPPRQPVRIAVFGSFYRGFYLLDELLHGPLRAWFQVVGVATDDVSQSFISRDKRVWQYPHRPAETTMVEGLAARAGLPVYKGRVKTEAFYAIYENEWKPEIGIGDTFGQRLNRRIFGLPRHGFFNLHPCINDGWPSRYAGPNPFQGLIDDGADHTQTALHRVDDGLDTGELLGFSPRVALPPDTNVVDMHKITAPVIAKFAVPELARLAGLVTPEEAADRAATLERLLAEDCNSGI